MEKKTKSKLEQCAYDISDTLFKWYKSKVVLVKDYGMISLYSQMLRSGTSIGANLAEAKSSRSNADYKSKISIALNEANEALYWLELLYSNQEIDEGTAREMSELLNMAISMLIATKNKVCD